MGAATKLILDVDTGTDDAIALDADTPRFVSLLLETFAR